VGGLTSEYAQQLLKDQDEYVRAWAIQLELEDQSASKSFVAQLEEMAKTEASAVVRMYLTSALQRLPPEQSWELAAALAGRAEDADDHNLPLLLWYGVEPLVQANAKRAVQLALSAEIDTVRRFVIRRASAQNDLIEPVVAALSSSNDLSERNLLLTEMLIAFEGRVDIPMPKAWMDAYEKVRLSGAASKSDSSDAEIARLKREVLDKADQIAVIFGDQRVFPPMRSLLTDLAQDLKRRQQALDVLVRGQDKASGDLLLTDSVLKNTELQGSAVRALVTLGSDRTPQVLLSAYTSFDEAVRKDVISTLVSHRPAWTKMLLETLGFRSDSEQ
jgi:HEAT repeat protein